MSSEDRANNFDLIRFLAATWVLVIHAFPLTGRPEPGFFGYDSASKLGVYMFFAISGYLVTTSWDLDPSVRRFAHRRALRIFPALILVVASSALILGPIMTELSVSEYFRERGTWRYFKTMFLRNEYELPGVFLGNVGGRAINGSLWTLPNEVIMYVMLAILGSLGLLKRSWVALVVAIAMAIGAFASEGKGPYYLYDLGAYFFVGSFLYLARDRVPLRPLPAMIALGVLAAVAVLVGGAVFHALCWVIIPYSTLAFAFIRQPTLNAAGKYGDFSYGIYIYAFPIQQIVTAVVGVEISVWLNIALVLAVTLLLSAASWHGVEKVALRFKPKRPKPA